MVRAFLDQAEASLKVVDGAAAPGSLTRSHTSDLRTVGWYGSVPPGWELAIDAEVTGAAVPPALADRFGRDSFWARWTRAESLSKLLRVPIVLWLRRHGLQVPPNLPAVWRTLTMAGLTVSVACVPATTDQGVG